MTTATAIKLEDELKERVRSLASVKNRTPHFIMREAIRKYVEAEESAQKLNAECDQILKEFNETGMHITGEEFTDWLDSIGTPNEKAAPECHK